MIRVLLWYGIAEACLSVLFDGLERNLGLQPKPLVGKWGHIPMGHPVLLTIDGNELVVGDWYGIDDGHIVVETLVDECDDWVMLFYPLHQVMGVDMLTEGEVAAMSYEEA